MISFNYVDVLSVLIATIAAVAAVAAVYFSKRATKLSLIRSFLERDADPEMGRSIKRLWNFKKESNEPIEERFEKLESEDEERWNSIDDDRRFVHKYYLQLMLIKQAGLISEEVMLSCLLGHQFNTVFKILEPLERKKVGFIHTKQVFKDYHRLSEKSENRKVK